MVTRAWVLVLASLGAVLAASFVTHDSISVDVPVWTYQPWACATPFDASDCRSIPTPERPSFPTFEACNTFRDRDLTAAADPKRMGRCTRVHEA